jgi:hypothetical protein
MTMICLVPFCSSRNGSILFDDCMSCEDRSAISPTKISFRDTETVQILGPRGNKSFMFSCPMRGNLSLITVAHSSRRSMKNLQYWHAQSPLIDWVICYAFRHSILSVGQLLTKGDFHAASHTIERYLHNAMRKNFQLSHFRIIQYDRASSILLFRNDRKLHDKQNLAAKDDHRTLAAFVWISHAFLLSGSIWFWRCGRFSSPQNPFECLIFDLLFLESDCCIPLLTFSPGFWWIPSPLGSRLLAEVLMNWDMRIKFRCIHCRCWKYLLWSWSF